MTRTAILFLIFASLTFSGASRTPSGEPGKDSPVQPHTNRLIHETSPYLLQHAHNPVDWYPWGEEAIERAKQENKPIFLSIGYAACHWCHVMEHESFENEEIAALMNRLYVCIKVDREERPDLDALYMTAVQIMSGQGGWPMTVFLTPDLKPFYGGTYFPPEDRYGRPGLPRVLEAVSDYYHNSTGDLKERTDKMADYLREATALSKSELPLTTQRLENGYDQLAVIFDTTYGGFGQAPKFPQPSYLGFLLKEAPRTRSEAARKMVLMTLRRMARGGMYDQLGGGFHRYSVDAKWLVPHFEKMLYDNALLPPLYLAAYQLTKEEEFAEVARETLDYTLRDMRSPEGGFYSSEDADSEGVEGKFYVWSLGEVLSLLGEKDGRLFTAYYGVTTHGNWEETNILNVSRDFDVVAVMEKVSEDELRAALERGRKTLFEARSKRVRPGLDDKILTGWNGLMISALAQAGAILEEPRYVEAAERAARLILTTLSKPVGAHGRAPLLRSYRAGEAKIDAFHEDYAYFLRGLLDLYEATFDPFWLKEADRLAKTMMELFYDEEHGGFFTTGAHHETLLVRMKDSHDGAMPSGNSVAVGALQRLALLTGDESYAQAAEKTLELFSEGLKDHPTAYTEMLCNLEWRLGTPKEIVVLGSPDDPAVKAALKRIRGSYLPNKVVVVYDPSKPDAFLEETPLVAGKIAKDGKATFYLCENFACQVPTTDTGQFLAQLGVSE